MAFVRDPEYGYSEETPILHTERTRGRSGGSTCWSKLSECWNRFRIARRYEFAILASIGFINAYILRINLSVTMVAMTKPLERGESESLACQELLPEFSNATSSAVSSTLGEFEWSSITQSQILGSFFAGYVITQLPGGIMAEKYGGKWLFGGGILITALFTLVTPLAARYHIYMLMFVRFMEGLGEGVTFPAVNALLGLWCPKNERSRISTLIFTGSPIGTVLAMALTGYICESHMLGGWPTVFYLSGTMGCLWFLFWIALTYDTPEQHPSITIEELKHIRQGQDRPKTRRPTPWREILYSRPVWALVVSHFGYNFGFYTLITELPTYLNNILHFQLKKNGVLSSLPYVFQAAFAHVASYIADKMRAFGYYKITTIRKIMNSIAFFIPGVLVGAVAFVGCRSELIMGLIMLCVGFSGFMYSGFNCTHVDMSPEYAGTLMGITNCIANTAGFLAPMFVGWCTQDGQTVTNWGYVFLTTAAVYFVTGGIYNLFASAEPQPWGISEPGEIAVEETPRPVECEPSESQIQTVSEKMNP